MPSVVNDSCVLCKTCVEVCPVGAFHDAGTQVVVNPDECIECGVCISECPQGAISPSDEADEKWIKFNAEKSAECPKA
ncbi:MAG: 4Fe-4S binding protein [Alphaproteobacteria bacterium]|nr:4Fe-4S binding protein [Alphaproteobacteria bacterium]